MSKPLWLNGESLKSSLLDPRQFVGFMSISSKRESPYIAYRKKLYSETVKSLGIIIALIVILIGVNFTGIGAGYIVLLWIAIISIIRLYSMYSWGLRQAYYVTYLKEVTVCNNDKDNKTTACVDHQATKTRYAGKDGFYFPLSEDNRDWAMKRGVYKPPPPKQEVTQ